MDSDIQKAIEILNKGGIIIFPTDTAFGIGCRMDNEKAIKKLFKIRNRPHSQATPVLVSSINMAQEYLLPIPLSVKKKLMEKYWPGPLTIIFPCKKDKISSLVRGGGVNLGVRVPKNETILKIIDKVGVPVLGPSANLHGEQTPYSINSLNKKLIQQVDFIVKGSCSIKKASTVIDCSTVPWKILRQGAISLKI